MIIYGVANIVTAELWNAASPVRWAA